MGSGRHGASTLGRPGDTARLRPKHSSRPLLHGLGSQRWAVHPGRSRLLTLTQWTGEGGLGEVTPCCRSHGMQDGPGPAWEAVGGGGLLETVGTGQRQTTRQLPPKHGGHGNSCLGVQTIKTGTQIGFFCLNGMNPTTLSVWGCRPGPSHQSPQVQAHLGREQEAASSSAARVGPRSPGACPVIRQHYK